MTGRAGRTKTLPAGSLCAANSGAIACLTGLRLLTCERSKGRMLLLGFGVCDGRVAWLRTAEPEPEVLVTNPRILFWSAGLLFAILLTASAFLLVSSSTATFARAA